MYGLGTTFTSLKFTSAALLLSSVTVISYFTPGTGGRCSGLPSLSIWLSRPLTAPRLSAAGSVPYWLRTIHTSPAFGAWSALTLSLICIPQTNRLNLAAGARLATPARSRSVAGISESFASDSRVKRLQLPKKHQLPPARIPNCTGTLCVRSQTSRLTESGPADCQRSSRSAARNPTGKELLPLL